jgi:hypothetical protein
MTTIRTRLRCGFSIPDGSTTVTVHGMDIDSLLGLETAVWQALVDGDAAADAALLADDFVGVYPTGFAGPGDHAAQLSAGPTVRRFQLSEARMITVSESAALLMYRAEYVRTGDGAAPESMYVSSLWCERDGRWLNVFSQDTPDTGIPVV